MNTRIFITHKDLAKIGYYFLDPNQEQTFIRSLNKELLGIGSEQEAVRIKKRTLNSLKRKRLEVLLKSAEKTADE